MQRVSAADFMLEDLVDVYEIKRKLVEQSVKRLLDVHLGKYIPEEGEIVGLWEPVDLEIVARRIARYNVEKLSIKTIQEENDEEKDEYVVDEEEDNYVSDNYVSDNYVSDNYVIDVYDDYDEYDEYAVEVIKSV
jgi:hypothetical protein